jgi:nucleoside-diphosphate-sugar epimerase
MEIILVTGSSGFLGSKVVELGIKGNLKVIGIDLKPPTFDHGMNFQFIQMDVNEIDSINAEDLSFIVHTASSLPYGNSTSAFEQNNIEAAKKISEFAKAKNAFLVEIGSSSVYGKPKTIPVSIKTEVSPLDSYARSKLQAEKEIQKILPPDSYAIIRPRTILGNGRTGIFTIFFNLILRALPIPLPNNGNQVIQFVHVQDLSNLSLYIGRRKISGIWPAASPDPRRLRDYLLNLADVYQLRINYLPINPAVFEKVGGLLHQLKLTKFTPWHFGAFPYDNYVTAEWKPEGFDYSYSCQQAFNETFEACAVINRPTLRKFRLGKKI